MKVVVIGSSNIDMVAQVNHLPAPGETVGDASFMQSLGGKGANQAVAAARLGGSVTFVTSLGNDMYADILKKNFEKEGITTDYIINDTQHPTGTALIFVADSGENCIAVAPGANYSLSPESINHFSKVIDETEIVVMQAEIPYNTIKSIALLAQQKGKKVLFNPAPAPQVAQPQNVAPQSAQQTIQPQAAPRQMPPQPQQTVMRPVQQPIQRPVQQPPQPQYGGQPMFTVPQGGYPPQNVGQQHPHYPQGEIPMFPHHEEPPMPEELQQAYMHEGPAYRPEDYEEYPDFPQSMLENHYSQAYAQTV